MEQKLKDLFEKQEELNAIINPNWKDVRTSSDFYNAFMVESGELLDHVGYKWWKKSTPDMKQARMEVVDMWFFYLSDIILNDCQDLPRFVETWTFEHYNKDDWNDAEDTYINSVIETTGYLVKNYNVLNTFTLLCDLTNQCGMSLDRLYDMYMGKLMLNIFRQRNGYSDGSYIKNWGTDKEPFEDNEALTEILGETTDPAEIEEKLTVCYKDVLHRRNV